MLNPTDLILNLAFIAISFYMIYAFILYIIVRGKDCI